MLTGYDQNDCFVGELFESHTLARFLVLMVEKEFEYIGRPVPRLLERNAPVYLVIDVFPESLVGSHDGQKEQRRQAPLFDPGLRPELFEKSACEALCAPDRWETYNHLAMLIFINQGLDKVVVVLG
jgi:hypothetical protein